MVSPCPLSPARSRRSHLSTRESRTAQTTSRSYMKTAACSAYTVPSHSRVLTTVLSWFVPSSPFPIYRSKEGWSRTSAILRSSDSKSGSRASRAQCFPDARGRTGVTRGSANDDCQLDGPLHQSSNDFVQVTLSEEHEVVYCVDGISRCGSITTLCRRVAAEEI